MKTLQINLHHCKLASSNLVKVLSEGKHEIVLVQEPWLDGEGRVSGLNCKGYTLLFKKGVSKIRSCILFNNKLNCFFLDDFSDGDVATMKVENKDGSSFLIASGYFPIELEKL